MLKEIKKKLITLAEIAHRKIFGHEMSEEMRTFLGHLSWSFFGGSIAGGIMFFLNIIAGRLLGPEEYGKYNLVLLMAQFFSIPMIFGMDVSVLRKIAKTENINKTKKFISSSLLFVTFSALTTVAIIFFSREFLASIFSTRIDIVLVAIIFSLSIVLKMLFDGIIKGYHFFSFQAKVKIFEAIVAVVVFFGLYLVLRNYLQLILSSIVSGLFVSVFYVFRLRKFFGKPSIEFAKKLLKYAKFVLIGSVVSVVICFGDRFVINKYFGAEELGIYSAYYTATILVVGQFISIITNVFFVMVAKIKEKKIILKKIDRMFLVGIVPVTFLMFAIGFIVLRLFGSAYKINSLVLFLFGFLAALQFFVSFYANIVNAHSERTYFFGLSFFAARSVIYVSYITFLVVSNMITIPAILVGLIINYFIDIINLRYIIKKYA